MGSQCWLPMFLPAGSLYLRSSHLRFKLAFVLLLVALAAPALVSAQAGATLALQAPAQPPTAGGTFTTPVRIAGAADLLGFQFDIEFDPTLLTVESVELGPLLAGAQPLGPDLRAARDGKVTFGGYTLAGAGARGASGDGVLAVIAWQALQAGESTISLSRPLLAGPGGGALPVTANSPLAVTIESAARFPWLWAGLAAAASLLGARWLWRKR